MLAYGWAFLQAGPQGLLQPDRDGLSVIVALVIGVDRARGLVADQLGMRLGPAGRDRPDVDLEYVGFVIVGLFVADLAGGAGGLALRPDRGALGRSR